MGRKRGRRQSVTTMGLVRGGGRRRVRCRRSRGGGVGHGILAGGHGQRRRVSPGQRCRIQERGSGSDRLVWRQEHARQEGLDARHGAGEGVELGVKLVVQ